METSDKPLPILQYSPILSLAYLSTNISVVKTESVVHIFYENSKLSNSVSLYKRKK